MIQRMLAWYQRTLLGGVLTRYGSRHGSLLANGLAYGLLFAFFAGVWMVFSVFGIIVSGNESMQQAISSAVNAIIPGAGSAFFTPESLARISTTLTWTGLATLALLWWTVVGWMDSLRSAVQTMFDVSQDGGNPVVTKLRDSGAVLLIALLFILSTVAIGLSGGIVRRTLDMLGVPSGTFIGSLLFDAIALGAGVLLNLALFALLLFIVAHVPVGRFTFIGSLLAAASVSVMQILGTRLLTGASKNPLLAPFAAVIGVLIWFNLIAQVVLLCSAFIAECQHRYPTRQHHAQRAGEPAHDDRDANDAVGQPRDTH